jgi:membrane protein YqaA with SNARE-associated domain
MKWRERVRNSVQSLQRFVDRIWYPPVLALLAVLDNFLVFIPTDGIMISSCMLVPRRWLYIAVCVALGSFLGAMILAYLVEAEGLPWLLNFYPGMDQTEAWRWSTEFFENYGLLVIFAMSALPFAQQPAVILASLAHTPWLHLGGAVFAGRLLKFLVMAYLGAYAPRLISHLWGIRKELEEVGIEVDP